MAFWQTFWLVALIAAGAGFLVLAVAVTIGALSDIRALLSSLRSQHQHTPPSAEKPSSSSGSPSQ